MKKSVEKLQEIIKQVITVITFLSIFPLLLYVVYYLIFFDILHIVGGVLVTCLAIHVNKSL